MRSILSERSLVVVLFIMVVVLFSFAQEDSKKMNRMYSRINAQPAIEQIGQLPSAELGKAASVPSPVNGQ
jgi:hypothetical protein